MGSVSIDPGTKAAIAQAMRQQLVQQAIGLGGDPAGVPTQLLYKQLGLDMSAAAGEPGAEPAHDTPDSDVPSPASEDV